MAKNCCICNAKIGTFDKPKSLIEGNDEFVLCASCNDKMRDAKATDIAPENRNAIAYHNRAIDYFAEHLASGNLDAQVVSVLEGLPDIADKKAQAESQKAQTEENERRYREERDSVIATTGYEVAGHDIVAYHGVVSTDNIIGTGIASELRASVNDIMGESSTALKDKLSAAKSQAYSQLLKQSILAGGNAIIGVSYNVYVVGSMLGVSVTGTSVTIEKSTPEGFAQVPVVGTADCTH